MNVFKVAISNFRSIKERQVFQFPVTPGLYYLSGPNGSGKSTLWEAIIWCLFGKTSAGLIAGEVSTWSVGANTKVELFFADQDGVDWLMVRTWKPNKWELIDGLYGTIADLTKDETNPVLEKLRTSFAAFTQTIVFPQGKDLFLDLKPEAKSALFSELLGLDVWSARSTRASDAAKALRIQVQLKTEKAARVLGALRQAEQVDFSREVEDWERKRKAKLDDLQRDHSRLCDKYKELDLEVTEALERLRGLGEGADEAACKVSVWQAAVDAAADKLSKARDESQRFLGIVEEQSSALRGFLSGKCPTCGQAITGHSADLQLELAKKRKDQAEEVQQDYHQAKAAYDKALDDLNDRKEVSRALSDKYKQEEQRVRRLQTERANVDQTLDSIEERAEEEERAENPWLQHRQKADDQVLQLREDLAVLQRDLDGCVERFELTSSWVTWFKEIRLELIGEALTQLEVEVSSCLSELGLENWELRFDVDAESAKGNVRRGFMVTVLSPFNKKPVPWESWSGGEAQRLRLGTQMGLANLARNSLGIDVNLEVWDEPTEHLEQQGVADLLQCLANRAAAEKRQVWIVDHRVLGFAGFAGVAEVTKSADNETSYNLTRLPV